MKRNNLLLFVFLVAITIFLSGCSQKLYLIQQSYKEDKEVKNLVVEDINMEIEIVTSDEATEIDVSYYTHEDYALNITYEHSNNTLTLKRTQAKKFLINLFNFQLGCKTVITVPKDFNAKVHIKTTNGALKIKGLDLANVYAKTTNGQITVESLNITEKLEIITTSGELSIKDSNLYELEAETTNGRIVAENVMVSDKLNVKTTNGQIKFEEVEAKQLAVNLSNGEVNLKRVDCNELLSVQASTGSIKVSLKGKESDYHTTLKTTAGELSGATSSGNKKVSCTTTVGSIDVTYLG